MKRLRRERKSWELELFVKGRIGRGVDKSMKGGGWEKGEGDCH